MSNLVRYDEKYGDRWQIARGMLCKDDSVPDDYVAAAFEYCHAKGLDILDNSIYLSKFWNNEKKKYDYQILTNVKHQLIIAHRTGAFAGVDEVEYGPTKDFQWTAGKENKSYKCTAPEWARATVYRLVGGVRCPFTSKVFYLERCGATTNKPAPKWVSDPYTMLNKSAVSAAIRLGFPEVGSTYDPSEFDHVPIEPPGVAMDTTGIDALKAKPEPEPVVAEIVEPVKVEVAPEPAQPMIVDEPPKATAEDVRIITDSIVACKSMQELADVREAFKGTFKFTQAQIQVMRKVAETKEKELSNENQ